MRTAARKPLRQRQAGRFAGRPCYANQAARTELIYYSRIRPPARSLARESSISVRRFTEADDTCDTVGVRKRRLSPYTPYQ